MLGILGVMYGLIGIAIHLCTLRSYGLPYLSPIAPFVASDIKDSAIRVPWWKMLARPSFSGKDNRARLAPKQRPNPGKGGEN